MAVCQPERSNWSGCGPYIFSLPDFSLNPDRPALIPFPHGDTSGSKWQMKEKDETRLKWLDSVESMRGRKLQRRWGSLEGLTQGFSTQ